MEATGQLANIPDPDGDLVAILEFALTFDGYQRLAIEPDRLGRLVSPVIKALVKTGQPPAWAGVDLLGGAPFYRQRQTHHWGDVPPEQERQMRTLVGSIGARMRGHPLVADQFA